jgi:hypothetical protein
MRSENLKLHIRHVLKGSEEAARLSNDVLSGSGVLGQVLDGATRLYPLPPASVAALLLAGVVLGAAGDALLRAPGPPGLNLSLWVASVAVAALALHRRAALALDRERVAWLAIGVVFAAGLAWRDAPPLKLLALGCATLTFALAAHASAAAWVRRAGVLRYAGALGLGALHGWTAAALALVDATRSTPRVESGRAAGWGSAAAVARGLVIAAPLVAVFGALFMSADAVFADLVTNVVRFDAEWMASHVLLFAILAWLSTGYLRGFLTGTSLPWQADRPPVSEGRDVAAPKGLALGITEVATALAAIDLLFLVFVTVQFRYLFGADTLVQITPDLTYSEYARRGFFELVFAVVLVVPVLLAADWLVDRRLRRDVLVFRGLAGVQIGLVLAIAASALQRLSLYYFSYGLTESRFYAMVLLIWIGAMLLWLAATVLRGRRDSFAFGALASGLATVALLFVINPDAIVARTNLTRMASVADAPARFDVAYATSLSADAVPVLIDALPALPGDVRCPLARHMLRSWPPDRDRSLRSWSWSAARASDAVREHETRLRSMLGPEEECARPGAASAPAGR